MLYVFGDHTLDAEHYELRQAGVLVRLEPRVFNLLAYLVQHPGRTVTKEELREQLWPDQPFMSDDPLTNCVAQARKAIGDSGQAQRYIKTVHGRGYRFIASVEVRQQAEADMGRLSAPDTPLPAKPRGLDQAEAESPSPPVPPEPPSTPLPAQDMASAPRTAGHDTPEAERRQLTVLSCRVIGAPPLSEPLDPEELLEVVRDYQAMCTEVVRRFEGHIAQYHGDRLVVYFGYPRAHEDDARRAVHTGLEIVRGMAALNRSLKHDRGMLLAVRVGIHTGIVLVGTRGNDEREQLALGNTPTIAAQVQSLAVPDTVVISPATWQLVEGYFVSQALGSHILEDAAESLAVYQVLQESPTQSRFEIAVTKGLTPLVGRNQEVELLRERWAQATDGMGQVVLLSGEAGIGKSRLVQALKEHLVGEAHTRIEYYGSPYYQQSAFYPLVDHLQRLLRFRPDDPPEEKWRTLEEALKPYGFSLEEVVPLLAALLSLPLPAHYPPLTLTPQRQKQKTFETLLAWWLQEAERQPVCFVMEDLHWMDPSTLEFLNLLIEQIPTTRMLMLLLFRPDFRPPWGVHSYLTHIALGRLSRRQVETMVERITGGKALPAEVLQELVAKTDGVPLFVEELTKMVLESGLVKEREGRYELAGPLSPLTIPATLHDSLMARLDRLGRAKQVAQLGATLGREFAYEVIQAVAPVDEATLQQALAQLVDVELLYQRGLLPQARYQFKHALIQDAAYQSLLRSTRRQYHRQIAQVLAKRFPETAEIQPELLAYHYTEAGLREQAIPYWQRAGQHAIERSANIEAIGHLTKGLEVLRTLPVTPERIQQELTLQLALSPPLLMLKGHTDPDVECAYTRAYELCQQVGDSPQRFWALAGLCRFSCDKARYQKALELGEQCFILAQRLQDPVLLQEAHQMLGVVLFFVGEFVSAHTYIEQAIALYDPQKCRSLTLGRSVDSGVINLCYASRTLWMLGYPDQALTKVREAHTIAQELSYRKAYSLGYTRQFAIILHQCRRETQLVQEHAEAAISFASERGFLRWLAGGVISRGWALAEQGATEEGIAQLRQGLATWRTMGGELGLPYYLCSLAEAYGKNGQAEEGLQVLAEALAIVQKNEERYYEAELYRLKGELLLQQTVRKGSTRIPPVGTLVVSETKEEEATHASSLYTEAEICFRQSTDIARHQHAKSLELRVVMSLSRLWQMQGKRAAARQMLAGIYGWFTEGFDTPDLQEARALLEALRQPGLSDK